MLSFKGFIPCIPFIPVKKGFLLLNDSKAI